MGEKFLSSKISIRNPSRLSDSSFEEADVFTINHEDKKWRLSYLKEQFESLELQELFEVYTNKIHHGYFSLFLITQSGLSFCHLLVVAISTCVYKERLSAVLPDLIIYFLSFSLSLIGLLMVDKLVEKYKTVRGLSLVAFMVLLFVNGFIPLHNYITTGNIKTRPSYTEFLILACYVYFGVKKLAVALIMGLSVTVSSVLILVFITYSEIELLWQSDEGIKIFRAQKRKLRSFNKKLGILMHSLIVGFRYPFIFLEAFSDVIFYLYLNVMGIYFRYLNEIIIRRSFLDRREFINSTHQLQHETTQTDILMQSIIPQYIINKVKKNYIEATAYYRKYKKHLIRNPFDNSLLDGHDNVSILFADIVNYTEMTIQLTITQLIDTLNNLFSSFDETSEKLKVSRIKFLGDCYYCVSGLPPDPAENHAEACVDLGLAMISIITNVRRDRKLAVNMRIGIHSGHIFSGIIGSVKYQFDIWSKDVDIANKMESEGEPGKVHITNKTKELLHKNYDIVPTNKGELVPQFKQNHIQTFLISPPDEIETSPLPRRSMFRKQKSAPNGILLNHLHRSVSILEEKDETDSDERDSSLQPYKRRYTNNTRISKPDERRSIAEAKRRTAFMNNNLKRYAERTQIVNQEMATTINNISFSKFKQYTSKTREQISPLLCFNNLQDELEYINVPDPLFKFYLLASLGLIICIYLIQNLTLETWELYMDNLWPYVTATVFICFVFLPLSFSQYIWNKYITAFDKKPPNNKLMNYFQRISELITVSFSIRFIIYALLFALFLSCFLTEAADCARNLDEIGNNTDDAGPLYLPPTPRCVMPWQMTQTCMLVVLMAFMFLRMFLWIKIVFATIAIAVQCYGVLKYSESFYKENETFNLSVKPQISHILSIIFLIVALHALDRQTDYMNRLNHLLNKKLKEEQDEANSLQFVNENLLLNILPRHVAFRYLDINRNADEADYEEHTDTAVMFASILINDSNTEEKDEKVFLNLMNDYITAFDMLINRQEFRNVEKIKVAKWTYMAACGLFPQEKENEYERHVTSNSLETLLNFACEMFKKLDYVNATHFQDCQLRIGICHGSIVAGVVGSKKPLYDIWGNPVNMASRMDSTGLPNQIQVLEETAEIIRGLGYVCEYRGEIYVKGREGLVRTYFVKLDEDFNLVRESLR